MTTDTSATSTLVNRIKTLLEANRMSQSELARRSGLPLTTVNRLFNSADTSFSPQLETVEAIATGFGISISELLEGVVPKKVKVTETPKTTARQISRLIEDFLSSNEEGKAEVLRVAECAAASNERND